MDNKKFNLWSRLVAVAVFVVAAFTYLSTIEPSASFWDCGEFIASSYKLEVGHPPGNPAFQLFARIFTIFGDNTDAAVLVNSMSALCSALTIFFLYLTIVFLAKRVIKPDEEGKYKTGKAVAIFASGAVGALAYCFSDTFWFSAVEGEVYAMSSLFTAIVFWAMTKWYEAADEPHANRWIVLISFLMGLSIGIHLLNLLTIPALVFLYYYRNREDGKFSTLEFIKICLLSVVILGVINFVVIPYLPKVAAYVDLFFVNILGLPYNTGAAFFVLVLLAVCFWGIFRTMQRNKVFWNTVLLCFTTIIIGFSLFSICIIRSCAKTPTNEYQPDNAFTLVRYLSREQYGSTPLIYGQYFDAPQEIVITHYWAPLDGKYKKVEGPLDAKYKSSGKMLFPRMWNSNASYIDFYESYMNGRGHRVDGASHKKPTMGANLRYFFDYQLNWMYWRYFMWNFAGRQNDVHSPNPGNRMHGNWECGIKFIDNIRLGDQSEAPALLSENRGKNHYFLLPLLLGLIGFFFQYGRDKRGTWIVFLLFFMTGIAIVLYLNQPPQQVRERDYAYAGSFYAFSIWIGLAVAAIFSFLDELFKGKKTLCVAALSAAACLCVPVLMAEENWDDHDRSNRFTAVELAKNYLDSVGENGILITHGDNDTFPLWYAQEVENIRTDLRIVNTSLLGTDWHIDQMKYAVNESAPLPLTVSKNQYLYGINDVIPVVDTRNQPTYISDVMKVFAHPDLKVQLSSGRKVDYIVSRKIIVPVNKENVIKYGILSKEFEPFLPDEIELQIPESVDWITKQDLFILDLLSNYQWDRPINVLNMGGDINVGIKDYLMFEGYSYKFIPFKNKIENLNPGIVDLDNLYRLMTKEFSWDQLGRNDYFADYQNLFTHTGVMPTRLVFLNSAAAFNAAGRADLAGEMLEKCIEAMDSSVYPYDTIPIGVSNNDFVAISLIELLYKVGNVEKARMVADELGAELLDNVKFYIRFFEECEKEFQMSGNYIYYLIQVMESAGDNDRAELLQNALDVILNEFDPS